MNNKRGQLTIFIIIALIIVAGAGLFFMFREDLGLVKVPASIQPVYNSFLSCLEDNVLFGIDVLETHAGYIYLPDIESGSRYMPFSSQLNFLGSNIPYWYYVSGNNIQKEQVPSRKDMEKSLEQFIESKIRGCVFDNYYEEGFEITQGKPKARVLIDDSKVRVDLNMNLNIVKEDDVTVIKKHRLNVNSKLGELYNSAKKIYNKEQEDLFLESYAIDVLRTYAPVDGVELTCSPKVWNANIVFDNLQEAIEANTLALGLNTEKDYFDVKIPVSGNVRFITSKNWPNSFEVAPSEGDVLVANPVGNQPGLGVLGFCYVPYHFVYNIRYPVLVQISEGEEIFQFPVAVVIQGNKPREALDASALEVESIELCNYQNTPVIVKIYDKELNPVEADVSYECFGERCNIGKTSNGIIEKNFPQCVNGYVIAEAKGFKDTRYLYSTTEESGSVEIIMDRVYNLDVKLKLDQKEYNGPAIISFISDDFSKTIIYPEQKSVELSEGQYEIRVSVYKNSSLKLDSTIKEQCVEIARSGIGGLLGMTEKKCFEINIPSQIISNVLVGGGKEDYYILDSELKNSEIVEINAESLPLPNSLEQLQDNYLLFEDKGLDIKFK